MHARVAWDGDGLRLMIGTSAGELWAIDGTIVDDMVASSAGAAPDEVPVEATLVGTIDGTIERLAMFDNGGSLAAQLGPATLAIVDPSTGEERSRLDIAALGEMTSAGSADAIVARTADITDPDALAAELVAVLGGDETAYRDQLAAGGERVFIDAELSEDARTNLDDAITNGRLQGVTIEPVGQLAAAGGDGVTFVGPSGTILTTVPIEGGATSVALVSGVDEGSQIYATSTDADGLPQVAIITATGDGAENGPVFKENFELPAPGSRIVYDEASELVEVLGTTQDGTGTTIYVVEPHGRAVFADHQLPFVPTAWVLDHNTAFPVESHGSILAFGAEGSHGLGRRRQLPLLVADAGRDPRGADGRRPVPPRPAAVRPPPGRRARRPVRAPRRDVLRPEPDRDERRLHGLLHPRVVPRVRLAVDRAQARGRVLAGHARDRRAAGPRAGLEVGRGLRHRRARDPRPRALARSAGSSSSPASWR